MDAVQVQDRLREQIDEINAGDADTIGRFVEQLSAGDTDRRRRIGDFVHRLGFTTADGIASADDVGPGALDYYDAGAEAFFSVLTEHPAFSEGRLLDVALSVFGDFDDPRLVGLRADASRFLVTGALALGVLGRLDDRNAEALMQVGRGPEAFSILMRDVLLGKPIPDTNIFDVIPGWLIDLANDLDRRTCGLAVEHALNDFGQAARGSAATSWATGITSLVPNRGCGGQSVAINGSRFGNAQSSDVAVLFANRKGSCSEAQVRSWSDSLVEVLAPSDVGPGCVGFVRRPSSDPAALVEAGSTLAGELERCVGLAAAGAAQRLRTKTVLGIVPCPPCLTGRRNYFDGGPPLINYFLINGGSDLTVEPSTAIVLSWDVQAASIVNITKVSNLGPFTPPPAPVTPTGSHNVGTFTGTTPADATYQITALNACGLPTVRTATVHLRKTPSLRIVGIEVVQAIQRSNNSVRLVANKRTLVRVFVDSGIAGDFDSGAGPNNQPNVTGTVTIFPAGAGQGFSVGAPLNAGGTVTARAVANHNRNILDHSLNFELPLNQLSGTVRIEARVFVAGHQGDVGGPWVDFSTTTVAFQAQPTQVVQPILIGDSVLGLAPPSLAQYNTSLQDARTRYPIAENGFVVNPELIIFTNVAEDLTTGLGWTLLFLRLTTMGLVISGAAPGGIRTAVVPRRPPPPSAGGPPGYAVNGIGYPRALLTVPSFVAQVGVTGTFAHEMGHTFGVWHAPCPPPCDCPCSSPGCDCTPPDTIDARLPQRIEDVGMDLASRTLVPSGRFELMSYCGDQSQCFSPGPTRWPSIVFWDIIFASLPI